MASYTHPASASTAPLGRVPNKVGRPRAFQDEDVYRVMLNVISKVGYSGLTFALVAAQIKCTTSALIRRFGDKRSLVQGFILWLSHQQDNTISQIGNGSVSPLERLRSKWFMGNARSGIMPPSDASPELFLAFFVEVRSDPAYRPHLARLAADFERQIVNDLDQAVSNGEIRKTDTSQLGHLLNSGMLGAVSLWLDHQREPIQTELARTFDAIMRPYLAA